MKGFKILVIIVLIAILVVAGGKYLKHRQEVDKTNEAIRKYNEAAQRYNEAVGYDSYTLHDYVDY